MRDDNFRHVSLDAVLVHVFAVADAAFNIEGRSLANVVACDFRLSLVANEAMPLGGVDVFAGLFVFALHARRQGEVRDGRAVGQVTEFRSAAHITDQRDFVE